MVIPECVLSLRYLGANIIVVFEKLHRQRKTFGVEPYFAMLAQEIIIEACFETQCTHGVVLSVMLPDGYCSAYQHLDLGRHVANLDNVNQDFIWPFFENKLSLGMSSDEGVEC